MTAIQFSKKLALLIGNNDYEHGQKLNCCINDVLDVGNELDKIGFQVTLGIDLTYTKMIQKILQFQQQIDKNDLVVFFFSGHGVQLEDQNYLVAIDNKCLADNHEMYRYHAIRAQSMLESMAKREPCAIIFILDCCRNCLTDKQTLSNIPLTETVQEQVTKTGLTSMKQLAGSLIAFACGPNEETLENSKNGRNSMFTYHLLKHIAEPNLRVDEIMCRVCNGIVEDTDGRSCSYWLTSLRTPNVYFTTSPKDLPLCVLLPSAYRNEKLEQKIDEYELQSMIYLRNENLTDDDMEIVATHAIIKKQCKVLYLQNNKITARGASIIAAALKNNTRLETLNLCDNHVSDMGVKSLSETLSSQNSTLMLLDLGSNEITDLGAQYLAEMLKINQTLVFLRLSFNQIGNQGIQLLTNVVARQNTSLQELYINGNKLISDLSTDSLVQMLKYHRSLKTFYVDQCNLSKKCKRKLRQTVRWKLFFSIHT